MSQERKRIVVIAPSCDGTDVGEAWSGYQWVKYLSEIHDITVLTYRQHGRTPLKEQLPDCEIIEWNDVPLFYRWSRFNSMLKPGMLAFNWLASHWLSREMRNGRRIDLIHQVTPIALRYASPAARTGIPFVIGPLAGGLSTPAAFQKEMSGEPWYTKLRNLDQLRIRHDPYLRRTFERAEIVIGVAPYVKELLGALKLKGFSLLSETAVTNLPLLVNSEEESCKFRLLYVGRITRMKGVRDAIRALSMLGDLRDIRFDIVGDGQDRKYCEQEMREFGLTDSVKFHGRVARHEVDEFYRRAHVFLFPSMREPSGNVVFEAMSFGLPLIVADRGGPGYVVRDEFGVRVPVQGPEDYAQRLAAAVRHVYTSPDLRRRMGKSARESVGKDHSWSSRVVALNQIYSEVLGRNQKDGLPRVHG